MRVPCGYLAVRSEVDLGLTDTELATAVASIVRLGMSHMLAPTSPPDQAAHDIGWLATQILQHRTTPHR